MHKKLYYSILAIIGIVFFILNDQTPFQHDDFAYCFFYDVDSYTIRPTDIKVTGFIQLFESMWNHYLCVNGRFVSHLLVQVFCAFLGKTVFNVINTIVFLLFIEGLLRLTNHKQSIFVLTLSFIISLTILPFPGQTMLWLTGSINYLWTATSTIWFIYWIRNCKSNKTIWYKHVFAFVTCLAIGWTQESITAPVALGLFIYYCIHRKQFKGYICSAYLGYALGAFLIVFGPGTFSRMSHGEISTQMDKIQFLFIHTYNTVYGYTHNILPILAIGIIAVLYILKRYTWKEMCCNLYCHLFFSFTLLMIALGMDEERMYFGVCVISLIIILKLSKQAIDYIETKWYFSVILLAIGGLPVKSAIIDTHEYHEYTQSIYRDIQNAPLECVLQESPYSKTSRFVYHTGLNADPNSFHNRVKAFYFGKKSIQALPPVLYDYSKKSDIANNLSETNLEVAGKKLLSLEDTNYWLLPIKKKISKRTDVVYTKDVDNTALSEKQRLIRYLLNTLEQPTKTVSTFPITLLGNQYLVLPKEDHIKEINIQ